MSLLSQLLAIFPALMMAIAGGCFLWLIAAPGGWSMLALIMTLYGLPLIVYRIHHLFYPITPGISYLINRQYSPWWGSYQIQLIYNMFPSLEKLLLLIPGAFSLWLRLWGSKIGRRIYWSPSIQIIDRGLLNIGDRVIFGHQVVLVCHAIKPKRNNLMLYVKPITIGNNVFISAGVGIAPGVTITDNTYIAFDQKLLPGKKILYKNV